MYKKRIILLTVIAPILIITIFGIIFYFNNREDKVFYLYNDNETFSVTNKLDESKDLVYTYKCNSHNDCKAYPYNNEYVLFVDKEQLTIYFDKDKIDKQQLSLKDYTNIELYYYQDNYLGLIFTKDNKKGFYSFSKNKITINPIYDKLGLYIGEMESKHRFIMAINNHTENNTRTDADFINLNLDTGSIIGNIRFTSNNTCSMFYSVGNDKNYYYYMLNNCNDTNPSGLYTSELKFITDKTYTYAINDEGNLVTANKYLFNNTGNYIPDIEYKIYDKKGNLIIKSEPYNKIIEITPHYVFAVDKLNYLSIYNFEDKLLSQIFDFQNIVEIYSIKEYIEKSTFNIILNDGECREKIYDLETYKLIQELSC